MLKLSKEILIQFFNASFRCRLDWTENGSHNNNSLDITITTFN